MNPNEKTAAHFFFFIVKKSDQGQDFPHTDRTVKPSLLPNNLCEDMEMNGNEQEGMLTSKQPDKENERPTNKKRMGLGKDVNAKRYFFSKTFIINRFLGI